MPYVYHDPVNRAESTCTAYIVLRSKANARSVPSRAWSHRSNRTLLKIQQYTNPRDSHDLIDGPAVLVLMPGICPILEKEHDNLPLLLDSFGAATSTAACVLNRKMKRCRTTFIV
jgi:hypothetical protein